jgi:cytochrome c peroxidase
LRLVPQSKLRLGDGHKTAVGENMLSLARNSPTIINRAWGEIFFWDGRAESLEKQAVGPIQAAGEMNTPMDVLIDRPQGHLRLSEEVRRGVPRRGITEKNIAASIATFERTIVSGRGAVRPLGRRRREGDRR